MKELHRLPSEVERDNPDLTEADKFRCYAAQNLERKAMEEATQEN